MTKSLTSERLFARARFCGVLELEKKNICYCFAPAMGRRKIEIQPITHERNRSVTFIKRKNGLFKKAYELGVLCSVDVAVIIFEERPGHQQKLYQYGSADVRSIVQRHLRYDGENDTKTPSDFAGGAAFRHDDAADGDGDGDGDDNADADDDDDDNDAAHRRPPVSASVGKRTGSKKHNLHLSSSSDTTMARDMDYIHDHEHRPPALSPHPPTVISMHHHHTRTAIPLSGERISSLAQSNKKPRLMADTTSIKISNTSRASSSSDDPYMFHSPLSPSSAAPLPPLRPAPSYSMFGGGFHHHHHHHHHQQQPPFLLTTNPSFDFSPSDGTRSGLGQRTTCFPSQSHYQDHSQQQQQAFFPQIMRQRSSAHVSSPVSPDLFTDTETQMRQQHSQGSHGGFPPLDWPAHSEPVGSASDVGTTTTTTTTTTTPTATTTSDETTWLDFLSGTVGTPTGGGGGGGSVPTPPVEVTGASVSASASASGGSRANSVVEARVLVEGTSNGGGGHSDAEQQQQ